MEFSNLSKPQSLDNTFKVIILEKTWERLLNCSESAKGYLLGTTYTDHIYITSLFAEPATVTCDQHFPGNVDLCGVFEIKDIDNDETLEMFKNVDITDNPILISKPIDSDEMNVYHNINGSLIKTDVKIVKENEFYKQFIHFHLVTQIPFSAEYRSAAISQEILKLRKQISGRIAFYSSEYDIYWLGAEFKQVCGPKISKNTTVEKILNKHMTEKKYAENREDTQLEIIEIEVFKRSTLDQDLDENKPYAPVLFVDKFNSKVFNMYLNIDALVLVHIGETLRDVYPALVEGYCRNVKLLTSYLLDNLDTLPIQPQVSHFLPVKCGHFITLVSKQGQDPDADMLERLNMHKKLLLPTNIPYFRKGNSFIFNDNGRNNTNVGPIRNPHKSIVKNLDGEVATVQGDYLYYHYGQEGMDDNGWGCAYRSLQTLVSWFRLQGFINRPDPSFNEIQRCLFDIGDKGSSFVGSKQWIGSTEVSFVLETLYGITSKLVYVPSGEDLATKGSELVHHFQTQGTPIMIGGGVLAHTILGVAYNRNTGDIKFLILDPHYNAKEDLKVIINKGWCGWKELKFWDKKSHYNMCLPKVPAGV